MSMQKNQGNLVVVILIVIAALALITGGGYLVIHSRAKQKTPTVSTSPTAQQTKDTSTADQTKPADAAAAPSDSETKDTTDPKKITDVQITLKVPGDESKLPAVDTPASFVSYMKTKLEGFDCDFTQFPEGAYYVSKINANFIKGSFGCGGGAAITWYLENGTWQELGYQSYVPCKDLVTHKIPSDFISDCYDEAKPDAVLSNPNGPLK